MIHGLTLYKLPDWEQVNFSLFLFPGGEPHAQVEPAEIFRQDLLIDARIQTMDQFMGLLILSDAIQQCIPASLSLLLPYFPGARQDRITSSGSPFTAKVFADIINAQEYERVFVVDIHSQAAHRLLNRCKNLFISPVIDKDIVGIICPDRGAKTRAQFAAGQLPIFWGEKHRDSATGELSGFLIINPPTTPGTYVVVDDLCDGGGTFNGLAAVLDRSIVTKLVLYVTHGIFSKGLLHLFDHYDDIITTDSFDQSRRAGQKNFHVIPILPAVKGNIAGSAHQ